MTSKQIDVIKKDFDTNLLSEYTDILDSYVRKNAAKLRIF